MLYTLPERIAKIQLKISGIVNIISYFSGISGTKITLMSQDLSTIPDLRSVILSDEKDEAVKSELPEVVSETIMSALLKILQKQSEMESRMSCLETKITSISRVLDVVYSRVSSSDFSAPVVASPQSRTTQQVTNSRVQTGQNKNKHVISNMNVSAGKRDVIGQVEEEIVQTPVQKQKGMVVLNTRYKVISIIILCIVQLIEDKISAKLRVSYDSQLGSFVDRLASIISKTRGSFAHMFEDDDLWSKEVRVPDFTNHGMSLSKSLFLPANPKMLPNVSDSTFSSLAMNSDYRDVLNCIREIVARLKHIPEMVHPPFADAILSLDPMICDDTGLLFNLSSIKYRKPNRDEMRVSDMKINEHLSFYIQARLLGNNPEISLNIAIACRSRKQELLSDKRVSNVSDRMTDLITPQEYLSMGGSDVF